MLDLKKHFTVGEKIQMDYIDTNGNLNEYISQVVEIIRNEFIDVLIPIHKKNDVFIRENTMFKLIVVKGDAIYELRAVLHEKLFGRIPLLRLKVLSEIKKIQRRDFYRLKVIKEIEAKLVEDFKERKYSEIFKCNLHDISAGGVLLSSNKELNEENMLEFTLDLNGKKLVVFGIIIRRTLTGNYRARYSYGVKFTKMSEFERNVIIRFIFEEQRRLIKKGLI